MKRFFSLTCALALTATLLTGCGNSASQPDPSASQPEETDYTPVTLTNYGREITVSKLPEKVLTLGPNCTELFVALGLGDRVIGRSLVNHSRGPLPEYADEVNAIPELNHASATREAILTSGADFIYAWTGKSAMRAATWRKPPSTA